MRGLMLDPPGDLGHKARLSTYRCSKWPKRVITVLTQTRKSDQRKGGVMVRIIYTLESKTPLFVPTGDKLMLELFKQNVLYPAAGRMGTALATWVLTMGATQQHADWLFLGTMGAIGVAFDLGSSWVRRRVVIDKVFNETLEWVGLRPTDKAE